MIHSSNYKPRVYPIYADIVPAEIDRLQEFTATTTLNRTKIEEIGRSGIVDWRKTSPSVSVTLRQLEYGNLEFYRKIANKGDSVTQVDLYDDFRTASVDLAGFKTDDSGTFLGTVYYPNLRLSGQSLSIGDPQALIERSFTFVGEDENILLYTNKYLVYKRLSIASSGNNQTVTLSDPAPVANPDDSGAWLFKVVKVSGGVATRLNHGTDWSYDGVSTLTINGASTAGDAILVWYSAGTLPSGESTFTPNDADVAGITAESASVYLQTSNYLYRLQSVGIDTTYDRQDVREVGNKDVVMRGVRDCTHRITLGRILEQYTIEEVLRGKAGLNYCLIDVRNFTSNMSLVVKIYKDNTKTQFKLGFKYLNLAATGVDAGTPLNDYVHRGVTLECQDGFVTTQESVLQALQGGGTKPPPFHNVGGRMGKVLQIEEDYLKELMDYSGKALVGKILKRFEIIESRDVIKSDTKELVYEEFRQLRDLILAHNRGLNITQFNFTKKPTGDDSQ